MRYRLNGHKLKKTNNMKVSIKQFKNLQNVEFTTPCKIYGKNGKGKSNSLNAILWVLSEKNTESDGVIPFGADEALVSVQIDEIVFTRSIAWKKVRKTGELESKITGTVSAYEINGETCNKSTFYEKVREVVGQVQYSDPLFFFSKNTAEKLQIINEIVGLPKPEANLSELARAVKKANADVDEKEAVIKSTSAKITDVSDFEAKSKAKQAEIEALKLKIVDKDPEIEAHNAAIEAKIKAVKEQVFTPKEYIQIVDVEPIKKHLNELAPLELEMPNLRIPERPILTKLPNEPIYTVQLNLVGNCAHCGSELAKSPNAASLTEEKQAEKTAAYEREMKAWISDCAEIEGQNEKNRLAWVSAKQKEEERYDLAVAKYEADVAYNDSLPKRKSELDKLLSETITANNLATGQNMATKSENEKAEIEFNTKCGNEILALKEQLKSQDYTLSNNSILNEISSLEAAKKTFDDVITINENHKKDLIKEKTELRELQSVMIATERKHIEAKELWNAWRNSFDKKCLLLFDGKVKILTTRETYSETTEDCFEVYFNRDGGFTEFASLNHSDKILCGVEISKILCKHFEVKIPLLIDNAEAINEARRPEGAVLAIVDEKIEYLIKY